MPTKTPREAPQFRTFPNTPDISPRPPPTSARRRRFRPVDDRIFTPPRPDSESRGFPEGEGTAFSFRGAKSGAHSSKKPDPDPTKSALPTPYPRDMTPGARHGELICPPRAQPRPTQPTHTPGELPVRSHTMEVTRTRPHCELHDRYIPFSHAPHHQHLKSTVSTPRRSNLNPT